MMEKSTLKPFLRSNLDILFIGLNPATGSSKNFHYFSVNQSLWNQMFEAGLITKKVDKSIADEIVFGDSAINFEHWSFGITDLITEIAESDSGKINPTEKNCEDLVQMIKRLSPKTAILLHGKVLSNLLPYLGQDIPKSNSGKLGELIPGCSTTFFNIAFPHGNSIKSSEKIQRYIEVKNFLLQLD